MSHFFNNYEKNQIKNKILMKKRLFFFKLMLLSLVTTVGFSQGVTVKGKVTESNGDPLYGVNVLVKGTNKGVISNDKGEYTISANKGQVIAFSYIGFITKEATVGNADVINITLATDANSLNEVVVTALGVSREKRALQYSVTEVGGENFTKARTNNLGNALSGRIAGVNV
jgi:CarboxypepD_reg-like domain